MDRQTLLTKLHDAVRGGLPAEGHLVIEAGEASNVDTKAGRFYLPEMWADVEAADGTPLLHEAIDEDLLREWSHDIARHLFGTDDPLKVQNRTVDVPLTTPGHRTAEQAVRDAMNAIDGGQTSMDDVYAILASVPSVTG